MWNWVVNVVSDGYFSLATVISPSEISVESYMFIIHLTCIIIHSGTLIALIKNVRELSLAGCRTMFLFAVSCKIGALERNAY